LEPNRTAIGTWSGGRYLRFGEAISEERLEALLRPGDGIDTVLSADVYGEGEADGLLGRALAGADRSSFCLTGAVGHDFYEGERDGPKGFPRFTDPSLRRPGEYSSYLRMATERSLERIGAGSFNLLLLHNPDRTGFESEEVWEGMRALRDEGLADQIGIAPGPANGFTLDLVHCFERFGEEIDWAMVILNPLEPWPGELCLRAAEERGVKVITRVVDYGGLFWDDVLPGHEFPPGDHRAFRPEGWVEAGRERLERLRPIAERAGLTPMQLSCQWNLSHAAVECVVPTLIQEPGDAARPVEDKRAELAALPAEERIHGFDLAAIRGIGDNTGCMRLKGAAADQDEVAPDRWPLSDELLAAGERWGIWAELDLPQAAAPS
jgi:aryl-alcohol dehydrogenase-like predicted oxidoreductase